MRSQRQLRVGEEIRHALADIFLRGNIPWPKDFGSPTVTVTEVQISPDLKNATIFAMPLGGQNVKGTVKVLNELTWFFRTEVARVIRLRYTPKFRFATDNSFDYAERIERILLDPAVARDLDPHDD